MDENRWTTPGLAREITKRLKEKDIYAKPVSASAVRKWRDGVRMPRNKPLIVLKELTGLSADDFMIEEPVA
jgi:hypothetical protein